MRQIRSHLDCIVNDITLVMDYITLELSDDDITDIYEAGGDDWSSNMITIILFFKNTSYAIIT